MASRGSSRRGSPIHAYAGMIEVSSSDTRAAEIGEWGGSWTPVEGPERRGGTYAAHWRKVDGLWKLRGELLVTLSCRGAGCS